MSIENELPSMGEMTAKEIKPKKAKWGAPELPSEKISQQEQGRSQAESMSAKSKLNEETGLTEEDIAELLL